MDNITSNIITKPEDIDEFNDAIVGVSFSCSSYHDNYQVWVTNYLDQRRYSGGAGKDQRKCHHAVVILGRTFLSSFNNVVI